MRLLVIAALLFLPATAFAKWPDQLWPCDMASWSYTAAVDARINASRHPSYLVSFTAFPSFHPEWGIRLSGSDKGYALRIVVLLKQIWGRAMEKSMQEEPRTWESYQPQVERLVFRFPVSERLASLLQITVKHAVDDRAPAPFPGVDGTGYQFSYRGSACAGTWSPELPSIPGQLVKTFTELKHLIYTQTPQARARIEKEATADLERLLAQL